MGVTAGPGARLAVTAGAGPKGSDRPGGRGRIA